MERERGRSVRGSERGRDCRQEDYSDTETVKQSHYPKSHNTTSRRPKDPSGGRAVKKFDNRGGPPPSRSATSRGFSNPFAPPSVAPSIANISPENHKSVSVVGDEVYLRDLRSGRDDETILAAAAERDRVELERRQGSLKWPISGRLSAATWRFGGTFRSI
ncbi:hypothetical protein BCON_0206g00140 [Botryotinia convoluta]|uniref:Uncharacterized protein n=1 Tax=Botryotinia convoluta TaxID=54673 RepID=A0A4Z1HKE1_9HELO|nr:hypothetical protein BCON_0206g00140 [Botryotinia convoluta]